MINEHLPTDQYCTTCHGTGHYYKIGKGGPIPCPHCKPAEQGRGVGELLGCPFCGGPVEIVEERVIPDDVNLLDDVYSFFLITCCDATLSAESREEAAAAWNRRPSPNPVADGLPARLELEARALIVCHGRTDQSSDVRILREAAAALSLPRQSEAVVVSDDQMREWAERHDLQLKGPDLRAAVEDAASLHMLEYTTPRPAQGDAVRWESRPVDKGTPPLNPRWTPCLREDYEDFIAGKTNGFREYREVRATPPAQADTTPAAHGVGDGLYYIQDTRGYVGNCVQWWGPERAGYTTRLDEAGRYRKDEALRQAASRSTDVAWPCDVIDKLARPTIDMQDLRQAASAPGGGNG